MNGRKSGASIEGKEKWIHPLCGQLLPTGRTLLRHLHRFFQAIVTVNMATLSYQHRDASCDDIATDWTPDRTSAGFRREVNALVGRLFGGHFPTLFLLLLESL